MHMYSVYTYAYACVCTRSTVTNSGMYQLEVLLAISPMGMRGTVYDFVSSPISSAS